MDNYCRPLVVGVYDLSAYTVIVYCCDAEPAEDRARSHRTVSEVGPGTEDRQKVTNAETNAEHYTVHKEERIEVETELRHICCVYTD